VEQTLFDEPTLAEAVGLKHVIEDGLAIIEGRPLGEARRNFVVHDLSELIDRAIRGSQIASQPTLIAISVPAGRQVGCIKHRMHCGCLRGLEKPKCRNNVRSRPQSNYLGLS